MAAMSDVLVETAIDLDHVELVAGYLVDTGNVAPSLMVAPDGRGRSCWVPLPAMGDRDVVAGLVIGDRAEDHLAAAEALAVAVDAEVRSRLVGAEARLVARRPGRRTVPQSWLEALTSIDPLLPASLDARKVAAFAASLDAWIASGAVALGRARLCLRVHEPAESSVDDVTGRRPGRKADDLDRRRWLVELLVQDGDEPSLVLPVVDLWEGRSPFPAGALEEVLGALAHAVRVAPELAPLLDEAAPTSALLDTETFLAFAHERIEPLAEVGVAVLLPGWWSRRGRVSLRAKSRSTGTGPQGVVTESGFGLEQLVSFTWEAALGGKRLTKVELKALAGVAAAKQGLVRVRGEWVQLDRSELAAIAALVGLGGTASAGEVLRAGLGLGDLGAPHGVEVSGVVATGWLGSLLDEALHATVAPIATPDDFVGELRPYQERGVGWLAFLGRLGLGACLADDMGLGKTAQVIATLLADPVPGPTLVICPVSVLGNWARELERFAPKLSVHVHHGATRFSDDPDPFEARVADHDVVLTTYSLVARDLTALTALRWGRIVLDEAQQVKNPGTAVTKAAAQLEASRRVALTGTPVENRLSELWSIMNVINPGLLGSLSSFTQRFSGPIERDQDPEATALLQRVTTPFLLRRLKSDRSIIDDLPDKIEQTEHCPLSREQATLYQAVVDELLAGAESKEGIARSGLILAGITKLKQVCNHPAHFLGDRSALAGRSGKLDRLEELLDEIVDVGDKVLCFTQFTQWGDRLVPHLARRYGTEPLWLHGGVKRSRREEMMADFQDPEGPQVLLLSLKAGGTGLNLTAASHVVHLDRWWNPAVEDQATDRAYRIGQRRTVLVHKLVSTGTIEERIDEMIASKRALAKRVVGTGEQWITQLDTEALRDVVALRVGEEA